LARSLVAEEGKRNLSPVGGEKFARVEIACGEEFRLKSAHSGKTDLARGEEMATFLSEKKKIKSYPLSAVWGGEMSIGEAVWKDFVVEEVFGKGGKN